MAVSGSRHDTPAGFFCVVLRPSRRQPWRVADWPVPASRPSLQSVAGLSAGPTELHHELVRAMTDRIIKDRLVAWIRRITERI